MSILDPMAEADAVDAVVGPAFKPQSAEEANSFFDAAEGIFDTVGFQDAAENLRRYRSGTGSPRVFSGEEIDQYPEFGRAEDINRTRFESRTFTASTNGTLVLRRSTWGAMR